MRGVLKRSRSSGPADPRGWRGWDSQDVNRLGLIDGVERWPQPR